jgi:hypothetical protein
MRRLLLRLYPEPWRRRYGDEFDAVLKERSLGPTDVFDVIHGAIDAHLRRPSGRARRGAAWGRRSLGRLPSAAAILGGLLWTTGMFLGMFDGSGFPWSIRTAFFGPNPIVPLLGSPILIVGTLFLLVALVGLGARQSRTHPRLMWASVLLPALGALVSLFALVGLPGIDRELYTVDSTASEVWGYGMMAMVVGTGLFSVATLLTGGQSRLAAAILLGSSTVMVAMVLGGAFPPTRDLMKASWYLGFFYLGLVAFSLGWLLLGARGRRSHLPAVVAAGR